MLGPLAVAIFAGFQLGSYGILAAALGAYVTFVTAEVAVIGWDKLRLRRARKQIDAFRARRQG
jgi:hypothetical protein